MKEEEEKKITSFKQLNKSNVWDIQENDVFRLWEAGQKDPEVKDNMGHYMVILRTAFDIEEVKVNKQEVIKKYQNRGFKVASIRIDEETKLKYAVKKHPITRVTDLTYENIRHITAAKLLEVIDRNFGGGWESLSQSIRDIIESAFDISTTTLPKNRLHKKGGLYEKKLADNFEVLEIAKGTWVEAIFAKLKPLPEKPRMKYGDEEDGQKDDEEDDVDIKDSYDDDDEDDYDEDKLTEESYRTTFETDPEDLSLDATEVADDDDY